MTTDQALTILRTGLTTFDEQHEIAALIKDLATDAERYRWLTKYTCQVLMADEKQADQVVDHAMGRGE